MLSCGMSKGASMDRFVYRKTTLIQILAVAVALSVLAPFGTAQAAAKLKIKPMITATARYDSNFLYTKDNARDVYSYIAQPGVQVGVETPKSKVDLSYTLEAYKYEDVGDTPTGSESASELDYIGHLAVFEAETRPTPRIALRLRDTFYRTRIANIYDELTNDVVSATLVRRKYDVNRFNPTIFYEWERRFQAGLRYFRTDRWYSESGVSDFSEDRWIANLLYNPTPRATIDIEYQRWYLNYDEPSLGGSNYTSDQLTLTYQQRYKYWAFEGGIGYHNREFDEEAEQEQDDNFNFKLAITGQNPPPAEQTRYLGDMYLRSRSHIHFGYEHGFNNLGYFFDYYESDRFTLSAGHIFFERIATRLKGYYQIADYRNTERKDDIYNVSGELGYLFTRKIKLSVTGGLENRDSNEEDFDYENEYVMLQFKYDFDIGSRGEYSGEYIYY